MQGIRLTTITLGSPDPVSLARFYARLLGWTLGPIDDPTWVGYRLAEVLPIPFKARQRLLELDDAVLRLEIIYSYLEQHKLLGGLE